MASNLRIYMSCDEKLLEPGLYLRLFHGRDTTDQDMERWGFNGPLIGPLSGVDVTYCRHIRPVFLKAADCSKYFEEHEKMGVNVGCIEVRGDCLAYGGKFYGDWTVQMLGAMREEQAS